MSNLKSELKTISMSAPMGKHIRSISSASKDLCFLESQNAFTTKEKSASCKSDEKDQYDPHDYAKVENATSFFGTVFHVMMIIAGPGLLSIPSAFVTAGYLLGVILVAPVVLLYAHNAYMILWSEYELCKMKRVPNLSYPEVVYHAFNEGPKFSRGFAKWSRRLSYFEFVLVWFSYYCYNYVIICQNLQVLFINVFHLPISVDVFLKILLFPLLVLSWIPKLKYLVPFSLIGSLCNSLSLLVIIFFVFRDPTPWQIPTSIGPLTNIPMLVGTLLFNLNIAGLMIPLKNEMEEPKKFLSQFGVLLVSFVPTAIVQTLFPLICALKYGDSVRPSVAENLPNDDMFAQTGILLSSMALLAQQPLFMFVPFDIMWNHVLKNTVKCLQKFHYKYLLKTLLVMASLVVSMLIPDVFLFLSFSGTVGTSIDSLIFPAVVNTIVVWKICQSKWKFRLTLVKNISIILLGFILVITGCYNCIYQIIYE